MQSWKVFSLILALAALRAQSPGEHSLAHDMLAAQNAVRAAVKVRPLAWSDTLARAAQEWADTQIALNQLNHRRKWKYGENLYEVQDGSYTPAQVVEQWAAELKNFDYKKNKCTGACGHYTQIVWADTKEVGCAVARKGAREVWVCEYNPPGNYVGERPY
jgi:pathogenesis-related protein 1